MWGWINVFDFARLRKPKPVFFRPKIKKFNFGKKIDGQPNEQEKHKAEEDESSDGEFESDYAEAIHLLDRVFLKQNNEPFQRGIFRRIEQKADESFAPFIVRLREQAQFCNFGSSDKFHRELLKRDRTMQEIAQIAQSFENVEQFEKSNKRRRENEAVSCPVG